MYTLYTRWVICDPKMNFGVILVKRNAQIEVGNAQNLFSKCQTFFRNKKEINIWSGALSISKKRNAQDKEKKCANNPKMCSKG